jgi:hypothetical protein
MKMSLKKKRFRLPKFRIPKVHAPKVHINVAVPKVATKVIRVVTWAPLLILYALRQLCYGIVATPAAIGRSPLRLYRKAAVWRDWLLAKIDYLQGESDKWRRTFNTLKAPYSILRGLGLSPQMAIGLLAVGTTATTGVVAAEAMKPPSFAAGDPGIYNAPTDSPIFSSKEFNTLRMDLGSTPIGLVEIENITLGTAYANSALPTGETNVAIVGGKPAVADPAFTETYLEVGHMTVDRWRCTTMTLTNIEANTLIVRGNASDGQSISATAGTPRDRAISGGNRADDMLTSGGYYDQLKITAASSGVNGKIDRLVLSNIYTKGGPCVLDRIKAGTLEIVLNEIGAGDGFATKDFQIATSVVYKSFENDDNIELSISPPS